MFTIATSIHPCTGQIREKEIKKGKRRKAKHLDQKRSKIIFIQYYITLNIENSKKFIPHPPPHQDK